MERLPRNVFRVCPENVQPVAAPSHDFKIYRRASNELLMICKNQITMDDVKKAARCAGFEKFRVYEKTSGLTVELSQFPAKFSISITKAREVKKRGVNKTQIFHICETTNVLPIRSPAPAPVIKQFKIVKSATGEVLRICEGQVTYEDLEKAARCARYDQFRAYKYPHMVKCSLGRSDFPAQMDVYISKPSNVQRANKTQIFHVCETTSVAPVRDPVRITPVVPVVPAKKKLLRKAIDALNVATRALEELYTTI